MVCPSKSRVRHGPEDSVGETEAEDQALGLNEEDAWSYTSPFSSTLQRWPRSHSIKRTATSGFALDRVHDNQKMAKFWT